MCITNVKIMLKLYHCTIQICAFDAIDLISKNAPINCDRIKHLVRVFG